MKAIGLLVLLNNNSDISLSFSPLIYKLDNCEPKMRLYVAFSLVLTPILTYTNDHKSSGPIKDPKAHNFEDNPVEENSQWSAK